MFGFYSRPETAIFSGDSSIIDANGGIRISGRGDTAHIRFIDAHHHEIHATLKVYKLQGLKKLDLYQDISENLQEEHLVHTWKTKQNDQYIIKYASQDQLGFVFQCAQGAEAFFKKLVSSDELSVIDYLREIRFNALLCDKTKFNLESLRNVLWVSEEHIQLLSDHAFSVANLLEHVDIKDILLLNHELLQFVLKNDDAIIAILKYGLSMNQLAEANLNHLMRCVELKWNLDEIVKVVTIQQVLGLNHVPKEIPAKEKKKWGDDFTRLGHGSGYDGEYRYHYSDSNLEILHEKSRSTFKVESVSVQPDALSAFNEISKRLEPLPLVHSWYKISDVIGSAGEKKKQFYCETLHIVIDETVEAKFPEQPFKETIASIFSLIPYYKEQVFDRFLNARGSAIRLLKQIPGMSQEKLLLLYQHQFDMKILLEAGVSISDLAAVEYDRLQYILENMCAAKYALHLVSARELLDLPIQTGVSHGLFNMETATLAKPTARDTEVLERKEGSRCFLM